MSAVLVIVTIPEREHEKALKDNNELSRRLSKYTSKGISNGRDNTLHTIDEALNESCGNQHNESNNLDNTDETIKELSFDTILEDALSYLGIKDVSWVQTKNGHYHQVTFPCELEESDPVLQYLISTGIGMKMGTSIGILPFSLYYREEECDELEDTVIESSDENNEKPELTKKLSGFKTAQKKFLKSVTARLTVAQVVESVRSGAELTFDFVCYLIFASWIAAMGLIDNSVVSLVASMLVSPMMGPVMALTFGTIIKDKSLRALGVRNLGVCFAISILFGFFYGLICFNFTKQWADQSWPSTMMRERGIPRVCWVGTLVALPSGGAVAVSLLAGNQASLVGVAIAVSLLPPSVNGGLLWAFATIRTLYSLSETPELKHYSSNNYTYFLPPSLTPQETYIPFYNGNLAIESSILGIISICLSLVNVTGIFVMALILLKIKEVVPLQSMSPETRRFFKEDLKIVRDINSVTGGKAKEMGKQLLKEWAEISGLDPNQLLSDHPDARATQLHTLADIARDVELDDVFQTVTRNTLHPNHNTDLYRRLSQVAFSHPGGNANRRNSGLITPTITMEDVEAGAIAGRRRPYLVSQSSTSGRTSRRSSRVSQIIANVIGPTVSEEESEWFAMKDTLQAQHSPRLNSLSAGTPQSPRIFTFNNELLVPEIRMGVTDRQRRRRSSLLKQSLYTSEHLPYSVWPSTTAQRFTVIPVRDENN